MARHKDKNWDLPEGTPIATGGNTHSWESIRVAMLMDLRDEAKETNLLLRSIDTSLRALRCPNFLAIPRVLASIKKNTTRLRRKKL